MAQFLDGDKILRGWLRTGAHYPGLHLEGGQIGVISRLSKERKTGHQGQTCKSYGTRGLEQTHRNLLGKCDSLFIAIGNRVRFVWWPTASLGVQTNLPIAESLGVNQSRARATPQRVAFRDQGSTALMDECLTKEKTVT